MGSAQRLHGFPGGLVLAGCKVDGGAALRELPLRGPALLPLPEGAELAVPLGERVLAGTHLTDGGALPVIAPTSGTLRAVEPHPSAHPSARSADHLVLDPDGADEEQRLPPLQGAYAADPQRIVARAAEAGIAGLGGASFPTWRKLDAAEHTAVDLLIINGAECEPYISCDDALMRHRAERVVAGSRLMARAVGAARTVIAIEDDKPEAAAAIAAALTGIADLSLQLLPTRYPEGGERQLVQVLTGREVPAGGIPPDVGVACQNVGTAAALADAVLEGRALTRRVVTVAGGAVAEPTNLIARLGTPLRELVEAAGGIRGDLDRIIMGGPLMGFVLPGLELPVVQATNCIILAAPGELGGRGQPSPCINCGDCAEVCPASLLPQRLHRNVVAGELGAAEALHLDACIACACCDLVCPSHIPLTAQFRYARAELAHRRQERERAAAARERFEARNARLARDAAEREARLAAKRAARKARAQ